MSDEIKLQPEDGEQIATTMLPSVEALEIRVGRYFAGTRGGDFKFNHTRGKWFRWTGKRWEEDDDKRTYAEMYLIADALRKEDPKNRRPMGGVSFSHNCLTVATAHENCRTTARDYDADKDVLGTPEGWVDLKTGKHHEPDRDKMISRCTTVVPSDVAKCPMWREFLKFALKEDKELIRYVQKFFGYCLSGRMNEEIMTFIYGPGGNGKGVLISAIGNIMGDYYKSSPASTFMATKHQEHPTELARLDGPRIVTASETNEDDKWNMSRIKEITGHENPISARFMQKDYFEFWPQFKLCIVGNSKPDFGDVDPAITRRLRMIEMTAQPKEVDTDLKAKLVQEYPDILRWMIDGFKMYLDEGMAPPEAVRMASAAYLAEQDIVQEFIGNWFEFTEGGITLRKDIGFAISLYVRNNGHSKKVAAPKVYKRLKEAYGLLDGETYKGDRCFKGVRLNDAAWKAIVKDLKKNEKPIDEPDGLRGLKSDYE